MKLQQILHYLRAIDGLHHAHVVAVGCLPASPVPSTSSDNMERVANPKGDQGDGCSKSCTRPVEGYITTIPIVNTAGSGVKSETVPVQRHVSTLIASQPIAD